MNEERLRDLIMIMVGISIAMVLVTVTVTIMMSIENTSENTLEITELERNYGYCMDTLKDVLPENLPENFDKEKVLGCGVTTELGSDGKCYPNKQIIDNEITVNLNGKMDHGDWLTINGTVPNSDSAVTGMIYHGETTSPKATIVRIFQTTSDANGFYSQEVRINDDYLWKKGVDYTISIGNNGDHKLLEFQR